MNIYRDVLSATNSIRFTALTRAGRERDRAAIRNSTEVTKAPVTFPHAQAVLDAICNLRAVDDAYGIGDGYFGQPLPPLYRELPALSTGEILEAVVHLLAIGHLRSSRQNLGLVWVTNPGWLHWTSWDPRNQDLLRHGDSSD